jgi:hypothetical protein
MAQDNSFDSGRIGRLERRLQVLREDAEAIRNLKRYITTSPTAEGAAMKSFRLAPASEGPRREFKITLGLRAGYGPAGRI